MSFDNTTLTPVDRQRIAETLLALGEAPAPEGEKGVTLIHDARRIHALVLETVVIVACERAVEDLEVSEAEPLALAANRFISGTFSAKAVVRRTPPDPQKPEAGPVTTLRTEAMLIASPGITDAQLADALPKMISEVAAAQDEVVKDAGAIMRATS